MTQKPTLRRTDDLRPDDLILRGVKLSHLRLMAQLGDTTQISAAAIALNISQPAASRLASELEQITGVPLYSRHPRGIELTEFGLRLAARARAILQGLNDAGRELAELGSGQGGRVNIGSVTGPSIEMVLPMLKRMRMTHPLVETTVMLDVSGVLAQGLLANRLDFYIGRIPADADPRLFDATVIGEEPIALIVRRDHPLTRQPGITIADCMPYDWVMQDQGGLLRRTVEDYLIARDLPLPRKVLGTASLLLTLASIMETSAIAPIARSVADFFGGDVGLGGRITSLPVAPTLAVSDYALIRRAGSVLSPAAQVFFDSLLELTAPRPPLAMPDEHHPAGGGAGHDSGPVTRPNRSQPLGGR